MPALLEGILVSYKFIAIPALEDVDVCLMNENTPIDLIGLSE